jgi:hypothetical protein
MVMSGIPTISRTCTRDVVTSQSPDESWMSTSRPRNPLMIRAKVSWLKAVEAIRTVSM